MNAPQWLRWPWWPKCPWWPWALVVALAPPLALAWAGAGYGMVVHDPWADIARLVGLALAEELVFRGGLQEWLLRRPALARRRAGVSPANALASTAFAAAHLLAQAPLQAAATGPVSLLLGAAYEAGGRRLLLPAALHVWFNACLYAASALLQGASR